MIVASEASGHIRAIKNDGPPATVTDLSVVYGFTIPNGPEELTFVPLNLGSGNPALEGFYGSDYTPDVIKADATQFTGLQGDVVVTSEFGDHRVTRIHFDGTTFVTTVIGNFPNQPEDGIFVTAAIINPGGTLCPLTQGFWKTHPDAWSPVTSILLGSQKYSDAELLTILKTPSRGDASLILAKQLIAAKLNIASKSVVVPAVTAAITDADSLLSTFSGKLPYGVAPSSNIGQQMINDATILDNYNNGLLTPVCTPR